MAARHDQATVVAVHLGMGEHARDAQDLAARHWPGWVAAAPELGLVPDGACGLTSWLASAPPERADTVLRALARLGAVDGGDDRAAALTLAWALLPGACTLAGRLGGLSDRIGEQVAAQLWIEIRTFAWQRLSKVAANVLANTRAGVLRECEVASQVERVDRTWARTSRLDPSGPAWTATMDRVDRNSRGSREQGEPSTREELLDLLDWACANDVIGPQDRRLLLTLIHLAAQDDRPRRVCRRGGLLSDDLAERAGQVWGVGPATIKRRATRSMQALSDAAGSYTSPHAGYVRAGNSRAGYSNVGYSPAGASQLRCSIGVPA